VRESSLILRHPALVADTSIERGEAEGHVMRHLVLALGFALVLPAAALAVPVTYTAVLDGPSEFPAVVSAGTGTATVVYDSALHTLAVSAAFSGLTGTTTVAHIHCCVSPSAPVPTADVATTTPTFPGFPAGVTAGTYSQTFDLTEASSWNAAFVTAQGSIANAEAALAAALAAGESYFNIHSSFATGGEIRGFLVPEPSAALLLGAGLVALGRLRAGARR